MTWFNIRCFVLSTSLFFVTHHSFGQLLVFFFFLPASWFFFFYFLFHLRSHYLVGKKKKAERNKKIQTLNNNLTVICFVFLQRWSGPALTIKLLVSQFTLKELKMEYSLN